MKTCGTSFLPHLRAALLGGLLLAAAPAALAQTGVTIGATTAPDVSAALDIVSTTKGALLPRVASAAALATPAKGLLVFQTGAPAGFYYNAGTAGAPNWQQIATAAGAAITADNGLSKTGQNIALGGTLTGATTIATATNTLNITSASASNVLPLALTGGNVITDATPLNSTESQLRLYRTGANNQSYGAAAELALGRYSSDIVTDAQFTQLDFKLGLGSNALADQTVMTLRGDGSVGIGTSAPDASAALDVVSSAKGALLPRLTAAARLGIASPAPGLLAYQTDAPTSGTGSGTKAGFYYNSGTAAAPAWLRLTDGGGVSYDPSTGLQVGPGPVRAASTSTFTNGATTGNGPFQGQQLSARTESIYTAAQLTAAGVKAGVLTSIAYNITTKASTQPFTGFTLALGNTAATAPGSSFSTGLTPVYSGNVTTTAGTFTLVFNGSAFSWDGTSNLVVQTCFANASATGLDAVTSVSVTNGRLEALGTSRCAITTGTTSTFQPAVRFGIAPAAYTLPATSGTAGQVLTQQSTGAVSFQDPQWTQSGTSLYPQLLTSNVGVGTTTPANTLDIQSANARVGTHGSGLPLYVTGAMADAGSGIEFRHYNGTQGLGFGFNSIYGAGSNATQNVNLMPKGGGFVGIGTITPSALLHLTGGGMKIDGANPLEFGAGVSGKETNAGKIGYQVFSADALDIVGAGPASTGLRKIKFYNEGGASFTGGVDVAGTAAVSGNMGVGTAAATTARLTVVGGAAAGALPVTSGTTQSAGHLARFNNTGSPAYLDLGGDGPSGSWLQSASGFNLGFGLPLLLNPIGGNVGIGTSSPAARLSVKGAGQANPATSGTTQSGGQFARFSDVSNLVLDLGGNGGGGAWLQSTDATSLGTTYPLLLNPNGGNVGIGTLSPSVKLDVPTGNVRLPGGGGSDTWFNFYGDGKNYLRGTTVLADLGGNVGIGTTSPIAKLHVSGNAGEQSVSGSSVTYFNSGTSGTLSHSNSPTGTRPLSGYFDGGELWVNSSITAGTMNVSSDARIKHNLGLSDRAADLARLLQLRITNYRYIDQVNNTDEVVKKVIAQEVRAVYPEATNKGVAAIPNVYEQATRVAFANGRLTVTTAKPHDLPAAGGRMRLYTKENQDLHVDCRVEDAHTFSFASAEAYAALFVYGKYVDDFLSVDYDALAMLNISATQELARQVAALQQENAALQTRAAQAATDHASLLTLQAQMARLLGADGQARK